MSHALQCPRCHGAVTVAEQAAGQRVKCPHCEQTFLAPGAPPSVNEDDDWLMIDALPAAPAKKPPPQSGAPRSATIAPSTSAPPVEADSGGQPGAASPRGGGVQPPLSDREAALLAEFAGDWEEFPDTTPPKPFPTAQASPTARPAARTPTTSPAAGNTRPGSPASTEKPSGPSEARPAASVEYANEYRVNCPTCNSVLHAKASQAGKTVKCSDCYSPITIPPPPKLRKKTAVDLEQVEMFSFAPNERAERRPDPFQRSAEQLLAQASRDEEKEQAVKQYDDDTPSVKEWLKNVFGIFLDPSVVAHWLGLSAMASVPVYIALTSEAAILKMGLFPFGVVWGLLVVSCGFAILQSVANDEESVSEWPTFDPFGWLGQLVVAFAAIFVAGAPIYGLTQLALGTGLLGTAITMVSIYLLFPFVLLSMLDMESPFAAFSAEVARSVTRCQEAWGGFYFSSGLLFFGLFLVFATASTMSPGAGAILAIVTGTAVAFSYFSIIGRLAFAIGQAVNAPPMENDIEQTRQRKLPE